jgi:prepilin-type N-terminal cleavage/methylation domain-containing protein
VKRLRRRHRSSQAGFTLIELMISLVMFSFAVAGVLAVAVAMASGFREQKQVVGAESSSRAGMEFLTDAIRGASPAMIGGNSLTMEAVNNNATPTCPGGPFLLTDNSTAPDELTVVFAYGSFVTASTTLFTARTDSSLTVVDGSEFQAGDYILITDYARAHVVKISSVAGNVLTMDTGGSCTMVVGATYNPGAMVVRALRARFYVAPLDGIPTLWMDPDAEGAAAAEPLAEGIEDMQVQLGVDPAGDGILDGPSAGDEWYGNVASDTTAAGTDIIRAVRLTLIAQSVAPTAGIGQYYRPAAGNHAAATTPDNYRRRILNSVIEVRNLGGSP